MDTHKPHHPKHDFQDEVKQEFKEAVEVVQEMGDAGKFNISKEFQNAIEIIKFSGRKMHSVSVSKKASLGSVLFILLTIVVTNFANYIIFFRFGLLQMALNNIILTALISFVIFVVSIFVYDFVGSYLFKGKGDFKNLFRVMGYGYLIMLVSVIPFLTIIGSLWFIIITYKALIHIKKLESVNAILTILITIVVVGVLSYILSMFIGGGIVSTYGIDPALFR